jgi:hypothetical protein
MNRRNFLGQTLAATSMGLAHSRCPNGALGISWQEIDQQTSAIQTLEEQLAGPTQGPWRRLFLDGTVVESQQGLERRFHSADKHVDNPLLRADKEWEGVSAIIGPYCYGTVFHVNGRFRLWYQVLFEGNHVGYAESEDGIHWKKPELDIIPYRHAKTNLVVSAFDPSRSGGGYCHNPSVVQRSGETDVSKRFALYGFDNKKGYPRVAFSEDGFRWSYHQELDDRGMFSSSDVVNFFFDPYQQKYFSTWKTRNRRGRAVGIATSKDGISWSKPYDGPVFSADDLDPSATQIYGMPAFPYQGLYIGIPWIYRAEYFRYGDYSVNKLHEAQADSPRTMFPQLAWSWDMVQWTRPHDRTPLIRLGEQGSWDDGMIVTARAPVIVGEELYFYYGGCDKVHDEKQVNAGIGLATMRLDGFCSMKGADQMGWLITRREPMLEPRVSINARVDPGGLIQAELLDRHNRVVPGFSREESQAFTGDSTAQEIRWNTATFEGKGKRKDYKIRFWIRRAELFSYLPSKLDPLEPDITRFQSTGP